MHRIGWTPVRATKWLEAQAAQIDDHGIVGDRVWSAVDTDGQCVRAGKHPEQLLVDVDGRHLPSPGAATTTVRYWGRDLRASLHEGIIAERLSAAVGQPVLLAHTPQQPGFIWGAPISVICLSELVGLPLPLSRYRANIIVDDSSSPLGLTGGCRLRIGTTELQVTEPIDRCVVIDHNPQTAARDEAILPKLAPNLHLGWGCEVLTPGVVDVGDRVPPPPRCAPPLRVR